MDKNCTMQDDYGNAYQSHQGPYNHFEFWFGAPTIIVISIDI